MQINNQLHEAIGIKNSLLIRQGSSNAPLPKQKRN